MDLSLRVKSLISPTLNSLGLRVVHVHLKKQGQWTLEVTIERQDFAPLSMDACVVANHEISALLDVEDLINRSYTLEVSSPGIDRPLIEREDYIRFSGELIKVKTFAPINERRKFSGILRGLREENIVLFDGTSELFIEFSNIAKARLDPELNFKGNTVKTIDECTSQT